MFQCQDVISSKPGFALIQGKWSNQTPQSAAFLEERLHCRFTYLAIMLSFKLVYYCVFFSCESNLISNLTKNILYEFLVFHMLFWGVRTFQNTVYDPLWRIKSSHSQVLKRQQLNFFSNCFHRKTPEQESHYNKLSYLKPAILLKKRLQHRCFTVSFSEFFRTATFNNISGWLLLVPCKLENNYVVTNKDF